MDKKKEKGTWVVVAEGPAHLNKRDWVSHAVVHAGTDENVAFAVGEGAKRDDERRTALWFVPEDGNERPTLVFSW